MKTGIQISSLRPLLKTGAQVRRAFAQVKALGCGIVQLQWIDPAVPVEEIARASQETGLQAVSTQDLYEAVRENTAYYVGLNRLTGGKWCCVSRIPERLRSREGLAACVGEFRALRDELARHGQSLCFHPVLADYQPVGGVAPVDYLLENLPWLRLCLDLYHLNRSGAAMTEWIRARAGRLCMAHFKDEKGGRLVPAGQGDTDWRGVAAACREAGAEYAFVEQETWDRDPFVCLGEALDWLNAQPGVRDE